MDMTNVKSVLRSTPPVKALRVQKWQRRAFDGMPPKETVAAAQRDPALRRRLLDDYILSDPAAAEAARLSAQAAGAPQTAEDMLWCRLAYGFSFSEYRCYGFAEKTLPERLTYFSDRESVLLSYRINDLDGMGLFSDKWRTYRRFSPSYGREAVCVGSAGDYGAFARFLEKHPDAIAKPAFGSCGNGVRRIDARSASARVLFDSLLAEGKTIVEEPIVQSAGLARFHPESVNTVRVVTFRGTGGVRLLWAFLKTGRGGSFTDNGASGGIMAGVDLIGGRVCTAGVDEAGRRYAVHPDSGAPFDGFALPEWRSLADLCVSLAAEAPEVRMIGWDAAHTDGGWVIVEGNAQSELIGPQAVFGRGLRREIMSLLRELRLPTDKYRI